MNLETLKASRKDGLTAECRKAIVEGFTCGDRYYKCSITDQLNYGATLSLLRTGTQESLPVLCQDIDTGQWAAEEHTLSMIEGVLASYLTHVMTKKSNLISKKELIDEATSKEDVQAITREG